MRVITLKNENTEFNAKIIISSDVINSEIQKRLSILSKNVKLPGFRPGKVPLQTIMKKYRDSVRFETIEKQINNSVDKLIKENNLNIIGEPVVEEFKDDSQTGIEFIVKCIKLPTIKMPDFKQIHIEKPALKVTDLDIKEYLDLLVKNSTSYIKEKEGKAELSDQVTIDSVANLEGVEFEGGKLTDAKLVLGSKSFIDTFEEQLVGGMVGDEIIVNVTFPDNYHKKDIAGKPAEFKVRIKAIHEPKVPEVNDEFAAKFNCKNIDELKEKISDIIKNTHNKDIYHLMKLELFNEFDKILDLEIPKSLIEKETVSLKQQIGPIIKEEQHLANKTAEELEEYYNKLAIRRIKIGLLLANYSQSKNLKINSTDIQNAVLDQTKNYPGQEKEVIDFYKKNKNAVESLRGSILEDIAVKDMFNNEVIIEEKEYSREDLRDLINKKNNQDLLHIH